MSYFLKKVWAGFNLCKYIIIIEKKCRQRKMNQREIISFILSV